MIEIENLSVSYSRGGQTVAAVRDVSLTIGAGEAWALVGESGCGKTTILRAVAGLIGGWQGRIRIDGADRRALKPRDAARRVQMVFQDPYGSLHPRQTVADALAEPLRVRGITDQEGRIARALDQVGLDAALRFRFPHQLSGGQRQRVAIARTLMLEPRILLLDEPTSALDVSTQSEILTLLADLRAAHNLTLLLVSHDLAVTARLCDQIAVMKTGRLVETVSTGQLLAGEGLNAYTQALFLASQGQTGNALNQVRIVQSANST